MEIRGESRKEGLIFQKQVALELHNQHSINGQNLHCKQQYVQKTDRICQKQHDKARRNLAKLMYPDLHLHISLVSRFFGDISSNQKKSGSHYQLATWPLCFKFSFKNEASQRLVQSNLVWVVYLFDKLVLLYHQTQRTLSIYGSLKLRERIKGVVGAKMLGITIKNSVTLLVAHKSDILILSYLVLCLLPCQTASSSLMLNSPTLVFKSYS